MTTVPREPMSRDHVPRVAPNLTLAVLALAALTYAVLSSLVVPALTTIQHDLHASETGVTWLLTAFLLTASAGTSILGRLGDMYGKERLFLVTLVLLATGTLLAALSNSLGLLIAARAIQGVSGGVFPLAVGIVRDEFPRQKVAASIGLLSATLGVGGGFGIVMAGVIVAHLNWHWLFWIPLIPVIVAALLTWRLVPESPIRVPGTINWIAALLMTGGLSLVLIAISETTAWGWGSPKTLALLGAGLALCALWVIVELRSRVPLIDMAMMRVRGVWTTNAAAFLIGGAMYATWVLFPQLAQLPRGIGYGVSVITAGLYLLPAAAAMFLVSLFAGRVASRYGSKPALTTGSAITCLAFLEITIWHVHPYQMIVCSSLMGTGLGFAIAALGNLIVGAVPPEQTGVATGMNTVMRTLGGAIGAQIGATLVANNLTHGLPNRSGFAQSFALATGLITLALLVGLLVPGRRPAVLVAHEIEGAPGVLAFESAERTASA